MIYYFFILLLIPLLVISVIVGVVCVMSASKQGRVSYSPLSDEKDEKDTVAQEEYGKNYDELTKKQKREVYNILPSEDDLLWDWREKRGFN